MPGSNKDYDYYFNSYLQRTGNGSLVGKSRSHMDDATWRSAHDFSVKQLRRNGFTGAKDRQGASTETSAVTLEIERKGDSYYVSSFAIAD